MVLTVRLRRILNQMISGNFAWEVPSAPYCLQYNERTNREISVPLEELETLVSLGYATRVTHSASARRLDCWVPTDKGRELLKPVHS
jgi:hypothetical protein